MSTAYALILDAFQPRNEIMHFGGKKAVASYLCRASNEGVRLEIIPGSFIQLENLASVARSTLEKWRC